MKRHSYSMFGQKTGMLLDSGDWTQSCVYFTFLKKLPSGIWEKPSLRQGKKIKFNIGEILQILQILRSDGSRWSTVHVFQDDKTSISFENKNKSIHINVLGYYKQLRFPDSRILYDLLTHIYKEKIEHATGYNERTVNRTAPQVPRNSNQSPDLNRTESENPEKNNRQSIKAVKEKSKPSNEIPALPSPEEWKANLKSENDFICIPGSMTANSEKAIAFQVKDLNVIWIPRSQVKPESLNNFQSENEIWVKDWFLQKKLGDIFATTG